MLRIFFCFFLIGNLHAGVVVLSGFYQGKDIYVQNPISDNQKDYCTREVFLNNEKVLTNIKSSVFEIKLNKLNLGDSVNIRIVHTSGCIPKILNPHVIKVNSAFKFLSFTVDEKKLTWETRGEKNSGRIYVEQYLNNMWSVVVELPSKGSSTHNIYSHNEMHCSGKNKYRIKYEEKEGFTFYSSVIEFVSHKPPVSYYPKRVTSIVKFSREVSYEVVDNFGNSVKRGYGAEVDMSDLKEGLYYLNFDNKREKVLKK
ncbi:MAG TPA: hypothetical protein VL947_00185 [Cytophagales bacterium]|nr:hypothetical protein [Cytophagales bacterium]